MAAWAFVREVGITEGKIRAIPTRASSLEGCLHLPNGVGVGRWAAKAATCAAVCFTGMRALGGILGARRGGRGGAR